MKYNKNSRLEFRINDVLKDRFDKVCNELGLAKSEVLTDFVKDFIIYNEDYLKYKNKK